MAHPPAPMATWNLPSTSTRAATRTHRSLNKFYVDEIPGATHLAVFVGSGTQTQRVCSIVVDYFDRASLNVSHHANPFIKRLSRCTFAPPLRIKQGSNVTVTATYDISLPRFGVMSFLYIAAVEVPGFKFATATDGSGGGSRIRRDLARFQPSRVAPSIRQYALQCCPGLLASPIGKFINTYISQQRFADEMCSDAPQCNPELPVHALRNAWGTQWAPAVR